MRVCLLCTGYILWNSYIHEVCAVGIEAHFLDSHMPHCHICLCHVVDFTNVATELSETGSDSEPETSSDSEPETSSDSEPETSSGSDAETGSGSDAETGSGSDAETGSGSDVETGSGSDVETGSGSDAETGSGSDAETGFYASPAILEANRYIVIDTRDGVGSKEDSEDNEHSEHEEERVYKPIARAKPKQKNPKPDGKKRMQQDMAEHYDTKLSKDPTKTKKRIRNSYLKIRLTGKIPKYTTSLELSEYFQKSIIQNHEKIFSLLLAFANFKYFDIYRMAVESYGSYSLISTLISMKKTSELEMVMKAFTETSANKFDFTKPCVGGNIVLANGDKYNNERAETPMEFAARNRNYEAVAMLVKYKAPTKTPSTEDLERIFKLDKGEPNTNGLPYRSLDIRTGVNRGMKLPKLWMYTNKWKRGRENKIRKLLKYKLH